MRYFFPDYCAIEDVSIIGDGSCDAEAAGALCNFDGGDCLSTIIYITIYYWFHKHVFWRSEEKCLKTS